MLTYVVVVVQLRGVEVSTFTQEKGGTLLFMYPLGTNMKVTHLIVPFHLNFSILAVRF